MARVNYVKHARQRYATVPVLDEHGEPKQVAVTSKRTGEQRVSKHGRPQTMKVTRRDLSKPLPNEKCGKCGKEIEPGQPYKWIAPKSGPYGGRRLVRCATCPTWHRWEYSSSISAEAERIAYEATENSGDWIDVADAEAARDQAVEEIRELAERRREAAQNMEDGFGHETYQSAQLSEDADSLDSWADEVEGLDFDDVPEPEEEDCNACDGTGKVDGDEVDCDQCEGTGQVTPEEPNDEQMDEWREGAVSALDDVLGNCPV